MKYQNRIIGLFCTAMLIFVGMARADTTIYDKNRNVQGYKKESGGTVTVYDKNWNRTGYEKGNKIYDKNWNVKGHQKTDRREDHSDGVRSKGK